jgi:hypothetical protein
MDQRIQVQIIHRPDYQEMEQPHQAGGAVTSIEPFFLMVQDFLTVLAR